MNHENIDRQPLSLDLYRRMPAVDHEERLIRFVGFIVLASIFSAVITFYAFA